MSLYASNFEKRFGDCKPILRPYWYYEIEQSGGKYRAVIYRAGVVFARTNWVDCWSNAKDTALQTIYNAQG